MMNLIHMQLVSIFTFVVSYIPPCQQEKAKIRHIKTPAQSVGVTVSWGDITAIYGKKLACLTQLKYVICNHSALTRNN